MISLACANIPGRAYLNVAECLISGRIGRGKYVTILEDKASEYFGVNHSIAVANGTLADIIMLAALKEMFPGKTEVILPALTFIAQANAVKWAGLNPVFVDVDDYFQMKWDGITWSEKTLCFFPVNLIGVSSLEKRRSLQERYIPVTIEDCCESMGGWHNTYRMGETSFASSFSMYPSHTITTGEGGLILTNDHTFHKIARAIHNHGKRESDFDFDYIGINAKMTNLQAAIGCELIDTIDDVNEIRRENVKLYNRILGLNFYASAPHCYPILYKTMIERNKALEILKREGIEARKLMSCIPETLPFEEHAHEIHKFPNAQKFANCGLFLPVHQNLKEKDIRYVTSVLPEW